METKTKKNISSVVYYVLAALCVIGALVIACFHESTMGNLSMPLIIFSYLPYILYFTIEDNTENMNKPLLWFLTGLSYLALMGLITWVLPDGLWFMLLGALLPILFMATVFLYCVLKYKTPAKLVIIGIVVQFSFVAIGINIIDATYQKQQLIDNTKPITTTVDGIYQRGNIHIVHFDDYGSYEIPESFANNLKSGDTVLVKIVKDKVYTLERK
ncbi:MAG: hypothetical protein IJ019_00995 [Alphaproteobacteria bacterium]|nr:hypothetical protein [Alphaproteobacteria bacterium]